MNFLHQVVVYITFFVLALSLEVNEPNFYAHFRFLSTSHPLSSNLLASDKRLYRGEGCGLCGHVVITSAPRHSYRRCNSLRGGRGLWLQAITWRWRAEATRPDLVNLAPVVGQKRRRSRSRRILHSNEKRPSFPLPAFPPPPPLPCKKIKTRLTEIVPRCFN